MGASGSLRHRTSSADNALNPASRALQAAPPPRHVHGGQAEVVEQLEGLLDEEVQVVPRGRSGTPRAEGSCLTHGQRLGSLRIPPSQCTC